MEVGRVCDKRSMSALVIYESMFGNTRLVAEAIARGIDGSGGCAARTPDAVSATELAGAELFVVGTPTHAWRMARRQTRRNAMRQAARRAQELEPGAMEPGVREWLDQLAPQPGKFAAAFDTRMNLSKLVTGSASRSINRALRSRGFRIIDEPQSFTVIGGEGPVTAGDLTRAYEWGQTLSALATRAASLSTAPSMPGPIH